MTSKIDRTAPDSALSINLRRLMSERRMSQGDLAQRAGLTRTSISAIINGGDVKLSSLERIAASLKTDVPALLTPLPAEVPRRLSEYGQPQVVPPANPMLAAIAALVAASQPQPQPQAAAPVPAAAQEFISMWNHLSAADIQALMAMARRLSSNRAVEATHRVVNGG